MNISISDEVYRRIWFEEKTRDGTKSPYKDAVVVIDSLSKTWSCGLRLGALISRNALLMEKLIDWVKRFSFIGTRCRSSSTFYARNILKKYETLGKQVETMYNELNKIENITHNHPNGAFYTMVDLPVDNTETFARYLVTDFRSTNPKSRNFALFPVVVPM